MCNIYEDYWWGCSAKGFSHKECTQKQQVKSCGLPTCPGRRVCKCWQSGICPKHVRGLPETERKKAEEYNADNKKRWNSGETRVVNYVKERPSKWHKQPACAVM
jgi:hypothetical protein